MKHRLAIALLLVLVGGLVAWRLAGKLGDSGGARGRQKGAPVVSVVQVSRRDLEEGFQSVGTVDSPQRVVLSAKVSGRIEELVVQPGDRVRAGQLLVRLDPGDLQEQVDQKRAELAEARSRLAQARLTQAPAEASVASALRQQHAAVATAEADLRQARQSSAAAVGAARAAEDNARAQLANAEARLERVEDLYRQAFTAAQDVDDARTQAQVARGQLRSAEEGLRAARARADADVAAAEARLHQARAALDYARANTAQGSAYVQNLAALQSVVEAAEASLESARSRLGDTDLSSPLEGYVTERNLDVGSLAQPGQPILTLQSTRDLWVTLQVPGEIRERLDVRTPARVSLEGGEEVDARILRLNAAADPESRQFAVRVSLPASTAARPGMFARVTLQVARAPRALAVPRSAVRTTPDGPVVVVVPPDGKVHLQPVSLGLTTPGFAQVLEGLKEGDRVVTLGAGNLENGQEVRVDGEEAAGERSAEREGARGGAGPEGPPGASQEAARKAGPGGPSR